jgi:hypothetical protein
MEFLRGKPIFKFFAGGGVEFREHFSFLHIYQDAPRGDRLRGQNSPGKLFGALARQACKCVLREVTRHPGSCFDRMSGTQIDAFKYNVSGAKSHA